MLTRFLSLSILIHYVLCCIHNVNHHVFVNKDLYLFNYLLNNTCLKLLVNYELLMLFLSNLSISDTHVIDCCLETS